MSSKRDRFKPQLLGESSVWRGFQVGAKVYATEGGLCGSLLGPRRRAELADGESRFQILGLPKHTPWEGK